MVRSHLTDWPSMVDDVAMQVSVETGAAVARVIGAVLIGLLAAVGIVRADASEGPDLMAGWQVYDYRAGLDVEPAVNVFEPAVVLGNEVWANHRQWSIDDPESPPSILALVRYDEWRPDAGGAVTKASAGSDLRDRCVSFELRGDGLDLKGAGLTFWVMASKVGQRWHTNLPTLGEGWRRFEVPVSEVEWRNSWRYDPSNPPDLEQVLARGNSYGIGMVGFGDVEPTGRLGMRRFAIGGC